MSILLNSCETLFSMRLLRGRRKWITQKLLEIKNSTYKGNQAFGFPFIVSTIVWKIDFYYSRLVIFMDRSLKNTLITN